MMPLVQKWRREKQMSFINKDNKYGLRLSLVERHFLNMSLHIKSSALSLEQSEVLCPYRYDFFSEYITSKRTFCIIVFTSVKVPGVFQIIHIIPRGMQTIEDMAMNQPIP